MDPFCTPTDQSDCSHTINKVMARLPIRTHTYTYVASQLPPLILLT